MRRVAITGMGIVSSLGSTLGDVSRSLREGVSGIEFLPERKEMGFHGGLSGVIKGFEPPALPKRSLRQMGVTVPMALSATLQAIEDARLAEDLVKSERTGVIVGTTGNMRDIYQNAYTIAVKKKKLSGGAMPSTMTSSVSANISVLLGTRGHCMTVSAACASGATAIAQGGQLIRSGLQDRVVVGGVQELSWEFNCNFDALRVFSLREDRPEEASRPFDKDREGLVSSGGAGMLVLEDYEHALARGATIRAELVGMASNSDGYDMTTASGEGGVRCMKLALEDADVRADQIDYINAHATSTPVGDAVEARSIASVFGESPWVSSTKSMTGHEIAAAGSNEAIYTLLMMQDDFIAPNINLDEIDEECSGIKIVDRGAIESHIALALSNSFGFGGVNTVLVFRNLR